MPEKLSEMLLASNWDQMSPKEARQQLKDLSDPQVWDQKDPELQRVKVFLAGQTQRLQ